MTSIIIQGQGVVGQATEMFIKNYNPQLNIIFNDPPKEVFAKDADWTTAE